jgi:hypothetical protein
MTTGLGPSENNTDFSGTLQPDRTDVLPDPFINNFRPRKPDDVGPPVSVPIPPPSKP